MINNDILPFDIQQQVFERLVPSSVRHNEELYIMYYIENKPVPPYEFAILSSSGKNVPTCNNKTNEHDQ